MGENFITLWFSVIIITISVSFFFAIWYSSTASIMMSGMAILVVVPFLIGYFKFVYLPILFIIVLMFVRGTCIRFCRICHRPGWKWKMEQRIYAESWEELWYHKGKCWDKWRNGFMRIDHG